MSSNSSFVADPPSFNPWVQGQEAASPEQEAAEPQAGKAKALVYDTLWRPNMTPPAGVLGFSCAVCGFVPSLHTDAAHVALHAQGKKHKLCERARAGDALANRRLRELQGLREEKEQKKKKTAKEAHEKYRCVAVCYGAVEVQVCGSGLGARQRVGCADGCARLGACGWARC